MKRKFLFLALLLTLLVSAALLFACGNSDSATPEDEDTGTITGVTFSNYTCDYDGEQKTLLVSGTIPEGVTVVYENNSATDSGVYNATATLSGEGYVQKVLHATLTINKLHYDTSSLAWNYTNAFDYDGSEKTVSIVGLPEGVTVSAYSGNTATNAGN